MEKDKLKIPKQVEDILCKLTNSGYDAYVVGGCVRDAIIGIAPHDWDICTSALPEQIYEVFSDYKIIPTGLKHGTVALYIQNKTYEVTTYRIDGQYDDCRHPQQVEYTCDLTKDLGRRDFTMNAIAYNPKNGFVDPYNGIKDIKNKTIRCVGNSDDRFKEDALRILRAARFEITHGLNIDKDTLDAMKRNKDLLKLISFERINSEFTKALSIGESRVLFELMQVVIPELTETMIERFLKFSCKRYFSLYVKMALLFDFEKEELNKILHRLKNSNEVIRRVTMIHNYVSNFIASESLFETPRYFAKYLLNKCEICAQDILDCMYLMAIEEHDSSKYYYIISVRNELKNVQDDCYSLSRMEVDGYDMMKIGLKEKGIKDMLNKLLDLIMKDKIENNKEKLISKAKELITEG